MVKMSFWNGGPKVSLKRVQTTGFLCLWLMLTVGCQQPHDSQLILQQEKQGIIGGEVVPVGDEVSRQTVFIKSYSPGGSGQAESLSGCTGSLVTPNVVLTAAHCIPSGRGAVLEVYWPVQDPELLSKGVHELYRSTVRQAIRHPLGRVQSDLDRVDLALLKLERKAPMGARLVKMLEMDPKNLEQGQVTAVGYGATHPDRGVDFSDLKLRKIELNVLTASSAQAAKNQIEQKNRDLQIGDPDALREYLDALLARGQASPYIWLNLMEGKGTCIGDSGGPIFKRQFGALLQVSLISFSLENDPSLSCRLAMATVPLKNHKDWLEKSIRLLDPSFDEPLFVMGEK